MHIWKEKYLNFKLLQESGIYHFSFTGLFQALNGHGVHANIIKLLPDNRNGLRKTNINLGHTTLDVDEVSTILNLGSDDNIIATITVVAMDRLEKGDGIQVEMVLQENHGQSQIYSDTNQPSVHFIGQKISD